MSKIYKFSDESVKRAEAAHTLGFDTIGREEVNIPGPIRARDLTVRRVFMKNVHQTAYLDSSWFPEIPVGEELAVTYIMHWDECNKLYRTIKRVPSDDEETNREILMVLAKIHCIWIRDVYSQQPAFRDAMPWPKANLMGRAFPIFEFMACFNPVMAQEGFDAAVKMDVHLQDELLKDYFKKGEEGFHFEVDPTILGNKEEFNTCLENLFEKFPHLREYNEDCSGPYPREVNR